MNKKYIDIIESTCEEIFGGKYISAESNSGDTRVHISSDIYNRYQLYVNQIRSTKINVDSTIAELQLNV